MNKNEFLHKHANRIVEVIIPPERLVFKKNSKNAGSWICDMQIAKGDICWVTGSHAVNNIQILVGGEKYELMNYFEFIVAKRRSTQRQMGRRLKGVYLEQDDIFWEIIPLNGYIIFEEVSEIHEFMNYKNKTVDVSRGIVRFIGKPNKGYYKGKGIADLDSGYDLKYGDLVLKNKAAIISNMHPTLEDEEHLRFDGDKTYFYLQRRYLSAVLK